MMYDQAWLRDHLPHRGEMCLLDEVEACDGDLIRCRATSHRDPSNPLRHAGRLGIAAGIEYAAQAMAAHGAMLTPAGGRPRLGYIASVRGVELLAGRLDVAADLQVRAERISGDDQTVLYAFEVAAEDVPLLRGRATVVLRAEVAA
ncbi:MAG: 3-hydroxylacyl-ACP dehydratase [Rhodocyclaceae bacterium]|nr:3-hydroxylacyl-ACP dehydratase [Rhodocyclaceae bacterium]